MSEWRLDETLSVLQSALGRESRRASVVASNLVNVETPGYRAVEIDFDVLLGDALGLQPLRTDPGHLSPWAPAPSALVREAPITRMRDDGNTVDLDREMMLLSQARGRFRSSSEMLRKRFALLVYAATDGRAGG